ncbi:MAG: tRNA preQ1(34) S-adenosylmethionine ribosyltransferase-isomerase QueA [Candidatus Poribacteria bacterium]|nr:tRNA preQ1(34) S-adenosylmethionine ribosyltransferase-isomerase QueA [Candidatus Poribacteria bacterium]
MKLTDYDYDLPEALIAQHPLQQRDQSRLMVIDRATQGIYHSQFSQLGKFLPPGSLLVINNTKVIPARLIGRKIPTGAKVEVLLIRQKGKNIWEALVKPGKRVTRGTRVVFGDGLLIGQILARSADGIYAVRFRCHGDFQEILAQVGQIPLPPYIKREPNAADQQGYQCVFAKEEGAVAAPTAGLHFTQELLDRLKRGGVDVVTLTLHVGLGTFQPVKVEHIEAHKMHAEYFEVTQSTVDRINGAKQAGRKIVAVGTTSVRALETVASDGGIAPYAGYTDIFIYPAYQFKAVDVLITNFHLPRSTLLMLVSAFAGREFILKAYQEAIAQRYRFFSYGDAMLIL